MSKAKKPTIGDTVHYAGGPYEPCRAATVIGLVDDERVNLAVFRDGAAYGAGPMQVTSVAYSEEPRPNTWHWPEK